MRWDLVQMLQRYIFLLLGVFQHCFLSSDSTAVACVSPGSTVDVICSMCHHSSAQLLLLTAIAFLRQGHVASNLSSYLLEEVKV
jgi:hypothetical protein